MIHDAVRAWTDKGIGKLLGDINVVRTLQATPDTVKRYADDAQESTARYRKRNAHPRPEKGFAEPSPILPTSRSSPSTTRVSFPRCSWDHSELVLVGLGQLAQHLGHPEVLEQDRGHHSCPALCGEPIRGLGAQHAKRVGVLPEGRGCRHVADSVAASVSTRARAAL